MAEKHNFKQQAAKAWRAAGGAFPLTLPVLTGYVFMGMAFGILLQSKGYGPLWALFMAVVVYAGSAQFVAVGLLAAGFNPLTAFAAIFMVNARYLFYGISMLESFKEFGKARYYLMFALTDETFALLNANIPPAGVGKKAFFLAVSALNHIYWISGCLLGALVGQALPINTAGIDFVMTALFVVILLEQWQSSKASRLPAAIGLGVTLGARLMFGAEWFLLPAMGLMLAVFILAKKPLERGMQA